MFLKDYLAEIIWPYHNTKNDFLPDQISESDGEKPAGEPKKHTRRASCSAPIMPSFFLCHDSTSFSLVIYSVRSIILNPPCSFTLARPLVIVSEAKQSL